MDFKLFEATPGIGIIVLVDPPVYTLLAATDDFISTYNVKREDVIGKGHLELLRRSAVDPTSTGELNLKASFEQVIQHKERHQIPVQRYDIPRKDGTLSQKYWKITHVPVLDAIGNVELIIHSALDVTEHVMSTQKVALTKDMEKAYHLFLNAPVIIGILQDDDYKIVLANNGLLEVWGKTDDVIGKPLLRALPELEEQGFISLLDQVRTTGEPFYAYEYPITLNRTGKEEVLYFDFVYKPIYENGADDKATGIISVGHEVTAQVIARRKEQESEAKYRNLFEYMDQGFCVLEMVYDTANKPVDYRFLEINTLFEKLTGLKNASGKTAREMIPHLEEHWVDMYGKVAQTGEAVRFVEESQVMGRWFDVYAFPIGDEHNRRVALLFTDITESRKAEQTIRESEERFRNLADDSPMFVFIIDPDPHAQVTYWNKTWLQYTGQSVDEARGRPWDGIIHPDDVHVVTDNYVAALELRTSYLIPSVRVRRHDGEYRWHAFKGNPRYMPSGEFNGYVGVGFDIHEQKLNEEAIKRSEAELQVKVAERTAELERTVEELKRSNQNLEEFAYAASHDLKEPMRKIQIFSERLQHHLADKLTADDKHYFDRIVYAVERMNTLIDDLLTYSDVSRGGILKESVDLNRKVSLVLEDLEVEIEEKKATIGVEGLPTITGHRRQLQQLFQNLIGNAIKYNTPGQSPRVHITCRRVYGGDDNLPIVSLKEGKLYYLIEVKDNGVGFDPEDAERIFNVFTRLHGSAEYKGTGVGLSIARKVVENHGGHIWAESKPGEGASFKVMLPAE